MCNNTAQLEDLDVMEKVREFFTSQFNNNNNFENHNQHSPLNGSDHHHQFSNNTNTTKSSPLNNHYHHHHHHHQQQQVSNVQYNSNHQFTHKYHHNLELPENSLAATKPSANNTQHQMDSQQHHSEYDALPKVDNYFLSNSSFVEQNSKDSHGRPSFGGHHQTFGSASSPIPEQWTHTSLPKFSGREENFSRDKLNNESSFPSWDFFAPSTNPSPQENSTTNPFPELQLLDEEDFIMPEDNDQSSSKDPFEPSETSCSSSVQQQQQDTTITTTNSTKTAADINGKNQRGLLPAVRMSTNDCWDPYNQFWNRENNFEGNNLSLPQSPDMTVEVSPVSSSASTPSSPGATRKFQVNSKPPTLVAPWERPLSSDDEDFSASKRCRNETTTTCSTPVSSVVGGGAVQKPRRRRRRSGPRARVAHLSHLTQEQQQVVDASMVAKLMQARQQMTCLGHIRRRRVPKVYDSMVLKFHHTKN